jgi:hypothetical protein
MVDVVFQFRLQLFDMLRNREIQIRCIFNDIVPGFWYLSFRSFRLTSLAH